MEPTESKRKADCKPFWIANGLAKAEWIYTAVEDNCDDISIPSMNLYNILNDKAEIINELCSKYGLIVTFSVIISLKLGNTPLAKMSKEFISFLAKINAEIGFDLYCYDDNNCCRIEPLN